MGINKRDGSVPRKILVVDDEADIRELLELTLLRMGLEAFVVRLVAPLTTAVGEAWMQGRFEIFEEHLYTECMTGVLRSAIAATATPLLQVLLTVDKGDAGPLLVDDWSVRVDTDVIFRDEDQPATGFSL